MSKDCIITLSYSDITKEKPLLEFLKEYMLLAEIAYIESNAPVSTHSK